MFQSSLFVILFVRKNLWRNFKLHFIIILSDKIYIFETFNVCRPNKSLWLRLSGRTIRLIKKIESLFFCRTSVWNLSRGILLMSSLLMRGGFKENCPRTPTLFLEQQALFLFNSVLLYVNFSLKSALYWCAKYVKGKHESTTFTFTSSWEQGVRKWHEKPCYYFIYIKILDDEKYDSSSDGVLEENDWTLGLLCGYFEAFKE
jgi:hypothetical protein